MSAVTAWVQPSSARGDGEVSTGERVEGAEESAQEGEGAGGNCLFKMLNRRR